MSPVLARMTDAGTSFPSNTRRFCVKLSIPAGAFAHGFAAALSAAARGNLQPVLSHVLCTAEAGGTVILEGTDNTRGVRAVLAGAQVDEPGRAILHGEVVGAFLGHHREGTLTLTVATSLTRLSVGGSQCRPPVIPADTYPAADESDNARPFADLTVADLLTAVRRSTFAASDDVVGSKDGTVETRGVLFQAGGGAVRIAGMTANMAAITRTPATVHAENGVMIPAGTLGLIRKNLPDDGGTVRVLLLPGDTGLVFRTDTRSLWVRGLNAKVPPVAKLVPPADNQPLFACEDATPLFVAASRASVSLDREAPRAECKFTTEGCVIRTSSPTRGESEERFTLPGYTGGMVECGFLGQSLLQIGGGLRKEEGVRAAIHQMGHRRLVVRYGTQDSGGLAILMEMGDKE